ncbi:cytochrome bd-I oxidase subunit CydH [Vibrio methylphosphonaticus]|nr:YnhF family membrane protein [Vibrio methylphosphonaticus]MCL9774320.1 YnhF family membrane protein [Vibrio methylphosphonaticus]
MDFNLKMALGVTAIAFTIILGFGFTAILAA